MKGFTMFLSCLSFVSFTSGAVVFMRTTGGRLGGFGVSRSGGFGVTSRGSDHYSVGSFSRPDEDSGFDWNNYWRNYWGRSSKTEDRKDETEEETDEEYYSHSGEAEEEDEVKSPPGPDNEKSPKRPLLSIDEALTLSNFERVRQRVISSAKSRPGIWRDEYKEGPTYGFRGTRLS